MELTPEQYDEILDLAGINFSPEEIAMYLDVDEKEFLKEWNNKDSDARYQYERGILIIRAESEKEIAKSARSGNITAYQHYQKSQLQRKFEDSKKQILLDKEMREYETLQDFINKGVSDGLPAEQAIYYEKLDLVRTLNNKYKSKTFIINCLMQSYPGTSKYIANKLYAESLNFFNCDNEIKKEAWANIYADRLDNAALLCFEMNDMENYHIYIEKAAKIRGLFDKDTEVKLPEGFYDKRPVFYSMTPKDLGLPEPDKRALAAWIDNLPVDAQIKNKLNRDARTNNSEGNFLDINEQEIDFLKRDEDK